MIHSQSLQQKVVLIKSLPFLWHTLAVLYTFCSQDEPFFAKRQTIGHRDGILVASDQHTLTEVDTWEASLRTLLSFIWTFFSALINFWMFHRLFASLVNANQPLLSEYSFMPIWQAVHFGKNSLSLHPVTKWFVWSVSHILRLNRFDFAKTASFLCLESHLKCYLRGF